jgi:protein-disulfide isomerase
MRRVLTMIALTAALSGPAAAVDLDQMTAEEKDAFGAAVREYLLTHPEVLMEAIAVLERREELARAEAEVSMISENAAEIFDDPDSWVGGNLDGDLTVVEFLDYRCGYCRRAAPDLEALLKSDGNIRWVVKEYPILGEESVVASRFALSVLRNAGDAAYEAAHHALMALRGTYDERSLTRLAESLDLDAATVLAGMEDPEIDRILAENQALARVLAISGTPSFVFGDQVIRGYVPLDGMRQIVRDARGG